MPDAIIPSGSLSYERAVRGDVAAFADAILQSVRLARARALAGRSVCLDGFQAKVDRLCARCLGLPPDDALHLRMHLLALRAELDATSLLISRRAETVPCASTTS